jgi:arsenite methyltransferase
VSDPWARWLLERRHGGDEERRRVMLEHLTRTRDRVLDNARIEEDDVVLDVGCGDGLIAFGALERGSRRVVFADVSEELLDVCRRIADGDSRCEFVVGSATDLPLPDESVDIVTTRSVVIYVQDKQRAFDEFFRVLRPGGRLSIFEPINSYEFPQRPDRFIFYDVAPVRALADKVKAYYRERADDSTLLDFDERDLVRFVEEAGFAEFHLEYEVNVEPSEPVASWEAVERSSGNPLSPTLGEAIDAALTPAEAARFRAHLRAEEESGRGVDRSAAAYVWAVKR